MNMQRFASLFLIALCPACLGHIPQPAPKPAEPAAAESPVVAELPAATPAERGQGNTGLRRSEDASGMPIPPGPGSLARPSGKPGNLTILPWAGFKAAVTYTFDDGNSSQIEHYDELQALGVPMTFYLTTEKNEARHPVWKRALKDGHELGNHTKSHAQRASVGEIDAATDFIKRTYGVDTWTMASPFGDPSYPPLASSRFVVNRGVVPGLIGVEDNVDPFDLPASGPTTETPVRVMNTEIDVVRLDGKWRIFLLHGFTGGSDGAYQPIKFADFVSNVNHAKARGDVWIDTMVAVASYWRGQKAVAAARPTTSGTTTTWTWTLPAHFPPGKYLRARIDGGTLSQNGQPLPWNSHGYYEIALDAGALTLSPDASP
jgi:peptidoglycan/xylan/chitin deacetylase (PgdA/CDA1 family)